MSADYGFDEEQHAQTNGDMDEGGDGLTQSNNAVGSLNRAQTASRWTDEQGAQDFAIVQCGSSTLLTRCLPMSAPSSIPFR